VIHVLYLHPDPSTATRVATALADADADVTVHTASESEDALDILRATPLDCVVTAFDPAADAGTELIRAVDSVAPDVPQVLAPLDDDGDVDVRTVATTLVDRIAAAAPSPGSGVLGPAGLLDAVPGIGVLVSPDGEIRRWNTGAADVLGADAVRRTDVTCLAASGARERLAEALATAVETGRHVVEAPAETPDGEVLDHEWTLTRVHADGPVVVVGLDISERAAALAELRAIETSLAALYRTLSDRDLTFEERLARVLELGCERLGVEYGFLTRIDGSTQYIVDSVGAHPSLQPGEQCPLSEAYCRKTIRGEGLLGVHNAVAVGWETDPAYDAFGLGCYLGGKVLADGDLYGTLCFADDDARETSFSNAERTFVELLTRWVSYELEERAARKELERQNDRLSEFASIVSHDLRNPLNVAQGQLDLARETGEASHLTEARDALDRMEALVTDLLDLAKRGAVVESADVVELDSVAEDAWSNVATGDAALTVETDGTIAADRERLVQLLENLFRNAVEHGSTGSRLDADDAVEHGSTGSRLDADDAVEHGSTGSRTVSGDAPTDADPPTVTVGIHDRGFYVADTGPGVPADQRDAVFDRGHSTNDGTGLGLTIVQAIADAHGWSVDLVESDAGGARFEFAGVDRPSR